MGDAAHTTPPYSWPGHVLRDSRCSESRLEDCSHPLGPSNVTLLETYESERSPAVTGLISLACAIGERVQITDPHQAQLRNDALRAANTGIKTRRSPAFPRLGSGLVRAIDGPGAHAGDGLPSIQARVIWNGTVKRMDEFLKPGWSLLTRHAVPEGLFDERQLSVFSHLPVQIAHISRGNGSHYIDLDTDYDLWFRATARKAFLVRPDGYIFGSARTIEDLPELIDVLADSLMAHGWHESICLCHLRNHIVLTRSALV